MKKKDKYIDIAEILKSKNPGLKKWLPGFVLAFIKSIVHEKDINQIMADIGHLHGLDFVREGLNNLNTTIKTEGLENIPKEGGVILASNHPLGGLDGIAFMKAVGEVRTDIKFLVNDILLSIENLKPLFLGVNKHGSNPREASKVIEDGYASDQAILVFPAGMVSRKLEDGIGDLEWKKSFISKAIRYERVIIPVYIEGRNSNFFYNLSRIRTKLGIKANLEMFYLASEMFKQRNKTITIRFGKPISYSKFDKTKTLVEWAKDVRARVYALANG